MGGSQYIPSGDLGSSSSGAPTDATYITQTPNSSLSAEQALSASATGYMKSTTGTGVVTTQAVPIPLADGGTNATDAAGARTQFGLVIGTNVQAYSASTTLLGNTTDGTGSTILLQGSPTILTPTIASFTNANHNHSNAAGGGTLTYTAFPNGTVVGSAYAELSSTGTTATSIPNDDTIPQDTEGVSILTVSITPKATSHKLRITATVLGICNTTGWAAAIFSDQDGTTNAVGVSGKEDTLLGEVTVICEIAAGTTSATTFDLRVGRSTGAGTLRWNGSGARYYGTSPKTSISVLEIKA